MSLTPHQQDAFDKLTGFMAKDAANMAVLEGAAGVGKTFLMGSFIRSMAANRAVCVAAPTHKALKVICETLESQGAQFGQKAPKPQKTEQGGMFDLIGSGSPEAGLYAATVHSLLALKMTEHENGTTECARDNGKVPTLSEYGLVVIDEASLISRDMFTLIMQYLGTTTKVLFIGDPAQLPPIDDHGAISPIFTHVQQKVVLSEIVRQAADNPIIQLSVKIRNSAARVASMDLKAVLPPLPASAALVPGNAQTLANFCVLEHQAGRDARVLCYRNESVKTMNAMIHNTLHPSTVFAAGEKVLVYYCAGHGDIEKSPIKYLSDEQDDDPEVDDYKARTMEELTVVSCSEPSQQYGDAVIDLVLETQNGTRVTTKIPVDGDAHQRKINAVWQSYARVNMDWQGERDAIKKTELGDLKKSLSRKAWAMKKSYPDLRHAYAMTVHRSQGSTFDTALVHYADINTMRSSFEFNRALYVACTRPRQYLAVVV